MANPGGGVGAKFVSVNLNKSYGQSSYHSHQPYGGSYGHAAAAAGRGRPGSGGGGSGGMVVLSRSRGPQKPAAPKLSVPPPLNLPSLRKEHEKSDSSGSGGGAAAGAGSGTGPRPSSSGMGWTKPAAISVQEKDAVEGASRVEVSTRGVDGDGRLGSAYMPPSARPAAVGIPAYGTRPLLKPVDRAVVLKGEDFPSLQAALPVSSGPGQKPKDSVSQKQKPAISEESVDQQQGGFQSHSRLDARSNVQESRNTSVNGGMDNAGGSGSYHMADQRKEDFFSSPLPMVRLNPRSDWADDERDTGYGIVERNRDSGFSKTESYWERDFDVPRPSVLPYKSHYDRRGLRDDDTGRNFSSDVSKVDPYRREVRVPSREGKEGWRSSPSFKDVHSAQEVANDRTGTGARNFNKDFSNENRYAPAQDTILMANQDSVNGRRNTGNFWEAKPRWNSLNDSNYTSRGAEQFSRYRADGLQNSSFTKPSFASGGKLSSASDSFLASGRDNRGAAKTERQYFEDPFMGSSGFDDKDPFSGGLVGVIKRRKDVVKQTELHDPVRESFEAELERVQKMQELERRRVVEEQERALEQARLEEEERQRIIREEEERLQRLEDETREATWRAEQERLESLRKAEELRVSREEEKRRMELEEERRRQAAKQKLIELEEKMAKRQVEPTKSDSSVATLNTDEKLASVLKDKDVSTTSTDLETWEDSERMVERLTTSSSVDSSGPSRPFETDSRSFISRDGSTAFIDRGKPFNSWRRDAFESGSSASAQMQGHEFNHFSPQRDSFAGVRAVGRREFHGGAGYSSSRVNMRGMQEPYLDEFGHQREQRWNFPGDVDAFSGARDIDTGFRDNFPERYADAGWAQNHFRGNTHSPYPERPYMNSEADDLYPYGRSRYSMRHPRVLPPPIASAQRASFRAANERPGPSGLLVDNEQGSRAEKIESTRPTGYYSGHQGGVEQSELVDRSESATIEDQRLNKDLTPRCDSQSSVSVSSPPSSPPHLSQDESGDSPTITSTGVGRHISQTGNEAIFLNDDSGHRTAVTASGSISVTEDEEWAVENHAVLQQQEEYDEDDDAYQEDDEVREGDDENLDLKQDFGDLHLEDKEMDNLVLGFDEGIEVELPNDDVGISESSQYVRERVLGDDAQGDEQHHELSGGFPSGTTAVRESDKAIQDSAVKPNSDPYPSISDGPSLSFQPALLSPTVDTQTSIALTSSSTLNQIDAPIKLQFGLFSGPSLIPSPVAAIQIGSIQMPLHPYHHIGPSVTHVHPSQPPLFQFGQVRYTSPISRGILPIAPPSMPFVQPTVLPPYGVNQNAGGLLPNKPSESTNSQKVVSVDSSSLAMNNKPASALVGPSDTPGNSSVPVSSGSQTTAVKVPSGIYDRPRQEVAGQAENRWHNNSLSRNRVSGKGRPSGNQSQHIIVSSENNTSSERIYGGMRSQGAVVRGKRLTYAVKNSGTRPAFPVVNEPFQETNGFQRRSRRTVHRAEFRVRENADRRPQMGSFPNSSLNVDERPNYNGRYGTQFSRSGSKRGILSSKPVKQIAGSEGSVSGNIVSQDVKSDNLTRKEMDNDVSIRDQSLSQSGEGNVMNISEEDFDATLQSGVVRVFKQSGIEVPSDEDDFIKVRSKRQMLNDRREQKEKEKEKEKEFKANSRAPRKLRPARQVVGGSTNYRKNTSLHRGSSPNINSNFSSSEGRVYKEAPSVPVSQPLAPIGTPAGKLEMQTDIRSQSVKSVPTSSGVGLSGGGKEHGPAIMCESKNMAMDNVQSSLTSWDNAQLNQQVMALTQTQLEEAMKAPRFDSSITSVSVTEPLLPSSSLLGKERSFSTTSSSINSLLAGEKIQFGAVTSPSILPPSSRAPGSSRPDVQIPHHLPVAEDDGTHVQDSEAEAEAAASAVAVAAIASDEVVGNGDGSVAISESKSFVSGNIDCKSTGIDQQLASQSRAEESLAVSLPADLSVETPPISLWPPLPSPQGSSNQMISHFPGGPPPSPFPFYEMNPMMGGPIFAFGPSEESVGNQSQAQKSGTTPSSGPLGTWQQCHSTMDSFYGHPAAGYPGPFIAPPGVQGPPHMVVYNHFAPVGQFGQVGLSFMGPAYIPSGKHSDWKHNSPSSSEGIAAGQRNHLNMTAPIQHLASGPSVMPPLAMYDVSPFQSAPDISVQAHWSHVAPPHIHSVPLSRPLQQGEGILPSPLGPTGTVNQSSNANKPQTSTPSTSEVNAAELGLADTSRAITTSIASTNHRTVTSVSSAADATSHSSNLSTSDGNNNEGPGTHGGPRMTRSSQQRNHHHYQRNNDWSHRRGGGGNHHGRNQSFGSERGAAPVKVKQVYVAKQPSSSTPASG